MSYSRPCTCPKSMPAFSLLKALCWRRTPGYTRLWHLRANKGLLSLLSGFHQSKPDTGCQHTQAESLNKGCIKRGRPRIVTVWGKTFQEARTEWHRSLSRDTGTCLLDTCAALILPLHAANHGCKGTLNTFQPCSREGHWLTIYNCTEAHLWSRSGSQRTGEEITPALKTVCGSHHQRLAT